MRGTFNELNRRSFLYNQAGVHHRDTIRDLLHDRKIVGYEQHGKPVSFERIQQVENLRLHRNVEG